MAVVVDLETRQPKLLLQANSGSYPNTRPPMLVVVAFARLWCEASVCSLAWWLLAFVRLWFWRAWLVSFLSCSCFCSRRPPEAGREGSNDVSGAEPEICWKRLCLWTTATAVSRSTKPNLEPRVFFAPRVVSLFHPLITENSFGNRRGMGNLYAAVAQQHDQPKR